MRIRVKFGWAGEKFEFSWFRPVKDFPPFLKYKGKLYQFDMYNKDPTGTVDQIFDFGQVYASHMVVDDTDVPDFEVMFAAQIKSGRCECGAYHTSFPQFHMQFCPEYGKIKQDKKPPDDEL